MGPTAARRPDKRGERAQETLNAGFSRPHNKKQDCFKSANDVAYSSGPVDKAARDSLWKLLGVEGAMPPVIVAFIPGWGLQGAR